MYDDHREDVELDIQDSRKKSAILKRIIRNISEVLSAELPTALESRYTVMLLVGIAFFLTGILLAAVLKSYKFLAFSFFTIYFLYMAYTVKADYVRGKIVEAVLICSSVTSKVTSKEANVVFRTDDETPSYYTFRVAKKDSDNFIPNVSYVIYFHMGHTSTLLGYEQL